MTPCCLVRGYEIRTLLFPSSERMLRVQLLLTYRTAEEDRSDPHRCESSNPGWGYSMFMFVSRLDRGRGRTFWNVIVLHLLGIATELWSNSEWHRAGLDTAWYSRADFVICVLHDDRTRKHLWFWRVTKLCEKSGKGKAVALQAWTGLEGSRRLRLPDFKTVDTWRW